jgi:hypothetical protein
MTSWSQGNNFTAALGLPFNGVIPHKIVLGNYSEKNSCNRILLSDESCIQ